MKKCVQYIWDFIKDFRDKDTGEKLYSFSHGSSLEMLIVPCLRNIDFSLGFIVDRNKLRRYMRTQDDYDCMLETEFGYTGVSIKHLLEEPIIDMKIKKRTLMDGKENWNEEWATYKTYLERLKPKEAKNKLEKNRYITFLVFQSGTCIMSGLKKSIKRKYYKKFTNMIREAFDQIEERLITEESEPMNQKKTKKPTRLQFVNPKTEMCNSIVHNNEIEDVNPKELDEITSDISNKFRLALKI